jgi:hypothetical protein
MLVNWAPTSGTCTTHGTSAHAGSVQFLPHESIGTASESNLLIGQNELCLGCRRHDSESSAQKGNVSQ